MPQLTARRFHTAILAWLVGSALLGIVIAVLTWQFLVLSHHEDDVQQDFGVLTHLDIMADELALARSSADRYLITGAERHRQQFEYHHETAARELTALQTAVTAGSGHDVADLMSALATDVENALADWQDLVDLRSAKGFEAVHAALAENPNTGSYQEAVKSVRTLFTVYLDALQEHGAENTVRSENLTLALSVAAALNLSLIVLTALVTGRQARRTSQALSNLDEHVAEADLINRFGGALQACRSMEDAQPVVRHFLGRFFPGASGCLMVIRASRNAMQVVGTWGQTPPGTIGESHDPADCWALRQGRVHEVPDPGDGLNCPHTGETPPGPYLCVPMLAQGESVGVLTLTTPDRQRHDAVVGASRRLLETVAGQVGSAVASLQLRESLRWQSIRDALTGLYNRRYLEETLSREQGRAEREGHSIGLLLLDLDHFKSMNDKHGHSAGDQVLKRVGELLRAQVRGSDIACRYGGEEMLVVLLGATLEQAKRRAEGLRRAISGLAIEHGGQLLPTVTASLGVAVFPEHGNNWEDVLAKADEALYRAKASGRDRVEIAGTEHNPVAEPSTRELSTRDETE